MARLQKLYDRSLIVLFQKSIRNSRPCSNRRRIVDDPLIQRSSFAKVLCKNCANSFMGIVALHSDFYYLVHSKKSTLFWSPPTQRGQNRSWIINSTENTTDLDPIPKPKSKLADTFGQYHNRYRKHISMRKSSYN